VSGGDARQTRRTAPPDPYCSWARACPATCGDAPASASRPPRCGVLCLGGGEAILANVSGRAVGSMGKPLPGTTAVKVAAYDLTNRRLILFRRRIRPRVRVDEVGVLLARVNPTDSMSGEPLRGVFEGGTPGGRPVTCSARRPGRSLARRVHLRRSSPPPTAQRSRPVPASRWAPSRRSISWWPTESPRATRRPGGRVTLRRTPTSAPPTSTGRWTSWPAMQRPALCPGRAVDPGDDLAPPAVADAAGQGRADTVTYPAGLETGSGPDALRTGR